MLNKQKVKAFFMNPWVVTVGGGIILLGVSGIWDRIQKKEFLTTLKTIIGFLWNLIIGFLNLQLRVWWLLVAIAIIVFALWIVVKIKEQAHSEPKFLKYTEDRFIQWKWSWNWERGYNKKWHVINLAAHCPQCNTRMYSDDLEFRFRCPRCRYESRVVHQNSSEVEAVIYDNLLRAEKEEAAQHK